MGCEVEGKPATVTEQVFDKTLETLYSAFRQWVKDVKGWHTLGGLEELKTWYKWLALEKKK